MQRNYYHELSLIEKNFLHPIRVFALVEYMGVETSFMEGVGIDKKTGLKVNFHKRRLTEDQDLFARIGDFVQYEKQYYEIVKLSQPRRLFGQDNKQVEVVATCRKAREGLFDAS